MSTAEKKRVIRVKQKQVKEITVFDTTKKIRNARENGTLIMKRERSGLWYYLTDLPKELFKTNQSL